MVLVRYFSQRPELEVLDFHTFLKTPPLNSALGPRDDTPYAVFERASKILKKLLQLLFSSCQRLPEGTVGKISMHFPGQTSIPLAHISGTIELDRFGKTQSISLLTFFLNSLFTFDLKSTVKSAGVGRDRLPK